MDLKWGSKGARKFVTNVGLITTKDNIMACEWTHQVSYEPSIIAICVNKGAYTNSIVNRTKEFGVNLASIEQSLLSSVAGGHNGKQVDKIKALKQLGFKFYKAKKIKTLMVKDAALNAECKLLKKIELGEYTMFLGKVVNVAIGKKEPLAYHNGKYWILDKVIQKPDENKIEEIRNIMEKNKFNRK